MTWPQRPSSRLLREKGWQRVLAETRIRGQTEAKGDSAASFLRTDVLHLSDGEVASLGAPLSYLSLKYETEAAGFTEEDPLAHPKREVSIEVLREDLRCLYVEVMSQWPQLAVSGQGTIEIDARRIRTLASAPSDYLKDSMEYVQFRCSSSFRKILTRLRGTQLCTRSATLEPFRQQFVDPSRMFNPLTGTSRLIGFPRSSSRMNGRTQGKLRHLRVLRSTGPHSRPRLAAHWAADNPF